MNLFFSALRLEEMVLFVRLGCTDAERSVPQEVRVTAELRFVRPPQGVTTDELSDTVCYAKINEVIRQKCEIGEYRLIESLAFDAITVTREVAGPDVAVGISVHKVRPPIENVRSGAFFRCGDFVW